MKPTNKSLIDPVPTWNDDDLGTPLPPSPEAQKVPRQFHPSRQRFGEWSEPTPKPVTPLDTKVVSYRLAGQSVEQIAEILGMTRRQVLKVLKPWGSELYYTFTAYPEYLIPLGVPDYLPWESPRTPPPPKPNTRRQRPTQLR